MRKSNILVVIFTLFLFSPSYIFANKSNTNDISKESKENSQSVETIKNNWGIKMVQSPFGLGLDFQTKYIWRGMEMMTEDAAPVLFPSINYTFKGLYIYTMGGYAINGKYAEVDLGLSYTWNGLSFGFNDYYYPAIDCKEDNYLEGGKHTGHWLEICLTYSPDKIPLWVTLSNFFYGADKYINKNGKEKQAYSTYMEVGTYYDFIKNNRISFAAGAAFNKSCYNGYEHNFSICNLELKYTYNVSFNDKWSLPLNVAYIYNPVFDKSYINFIANLAF